MKRLTLLLLLCFWCGTSALAQTGTSKTPAALNTETNALWPDNTAGSITPFNARQTLLDIIASSAPFSGTTCLSSLQQYQAFANTTSAPTGTTLNFFDGAVCVPWATFNQTAHTITLASATIPPPTAATLGGVFSITQVAHNWITYIDTTGLPHQAQPNYTDLAGTVPAINPGTSGVGGIAYADAHVNVLRNSSLTAWFHGCVSGTCTHTTSAATSNYSAEGVFILPTGASVTSQAVTTCPTGNPAYYCLTRSLA